MSDQQVDVLIIGGGLTGAALMLALQDSGLTTALVESKPFSVKTSFDFDARSLALSPASRRILQGLYLVKQKRRVRYIAWRILRIKVGRWYVHCPC